MYNLFIHRMPHVFLEVGGYTSDTTYIWDENCRDYKDNAQRFFNLKSQLSPWQYSRNRPKKEGK